MHVLSNFRRSYFTDPEHKFRLAFQPKIEDLLNSRKGLNFIWQEGRKKYIHLSRDRQNAAIRDISQSKLSTCPYTPSLFLVTIDD